MKNLQPHHCGKSRKSFKKLNRQEHCCNKNIPCAVDPNSVLHECIFCNDLFQDDLHLAAVPQNDAAEAAADEILSFLLVVESPQSALS